ncbi:hypothetical protein [Halocalculus aciditolerans]|uniref:DUF6199 domain-containing protein n=1 Tax=Halocalculus aciditolerans TaxID=1383812 RepID=A0A830FME1_9EURY|nr:hypothetical protein [Halocalculus aciditolerans]GGL70104.1 hypothetical protein GCM10009039_30170 [Halocalculus aciditolerans]
MDARALLTVALGVLLGVFLLAFPDTAFRLRALGRAPTTGRGRYGSENPAPGWVRWLIRFFGVVCLAVAASILLG